MLIKLFFNVNNVINIEVLEVLDNFHDPIQFLSYDDISVGEYIFLNIPLIQGVLLLLLFCNRCNAAVVTSPMRRNLLDCFVR